jgi:demethylmenaquinone methyltransferase/2-methoxy-6-polyprenyl-1,4-benzoquinol methylase
VVHQPNKEKVRAMFDDISSRYDFLNHFLSFGIDRSWRRKLVRILAAKKPARVLDVATGTADLAIAIRKAGPRRIDGIDISSNMVAVGVQKLEKLGISNEIFLQVADAEMIPFANNTFDAVTVAFGVRNFEDLLKGLSEMHRVLRQGGQVLILEFSHPDTFPMKQLYGFYSRFIIPITGKLISGNSTAYTYLPESVAAFPSGIDFIRVMKEAGFNHPAQRRLSMGIASIYTAEK